MISVALVFLVVSSSPPNSLIPSDELKKHYDALVEDRKKSRVLQVLTQPSEPIVFSESYQARIEEFIDDIVHVSVLLNPSQRALLVKRGEPVLAKDKPVRGSAIVGARHHRILRMSKETQARVSLLSEFVGKDVELKLCRAGSDVHLEVADIRAITPSIEGR